MAYDWDEPCMVDRVGMVELCEMGAWFEAAWDVCIGEDIGDEW